MPVKTLQKLGSLGSRWGKVCICTRPVTRHIYRAYAGRHPRALVHLGGEAKVTIRFFRAMIAIAACSTTGALHLARPFKTFLRLPACHVVEFDASLSGLGLLFYTIAEEGFEVPVAHAQVDIGTLGFGEDSSFQNTAEFIGGVVALRGLWMLGMHRDTVLFRGDSISALTWIEKVGAKSDRAIPASLVFAYQSLFYGFAGIRTEHQAGVDHVLADSRSRKGTLSDLGPAWAGQPELDLKATQLLELCRPGRSLTSTDELVHFLCLVKREVLSVPEGVWQSGVSSSC